MPTVEVLPPEEPKLLLSGKKRPGFALPEGTPAVLSVVPRVYKGRPSKYVDSEGRSLQTVAFETYRDMGESRSLTRVSIDLNIPIRVLRGWAYKHKWTNQIVLAAPKQAKPQSVAERDQDRVVKKIVKAVDRQVDLVNLRHSLMTVQDPAEPGKELPTKELSAYSLKETGAVLLSAVKSLAEVLGLQKLKKEIESEGNSGGGSGRGPKSAVQVNVIFKG